MSDRTPIMLTLTARNVSADGRRVTPGDGVTNMEIGEADALAALRAFAAVPAMELVDVEAKIYLAGPRGKVAVQSVRGKLFVATVPESVNAAMERTPEETIALLTAADPASAAMADAAETAKVVEAMAEAARAPTGVRGWLNSVWLLLFLAAIAGSLAWFNFAPETPDGVVMITDAAKVAVLHTQLNGRYGTAGATTLRLENGKLTGHQSSPAGDDVPTAFIDLGYRLGERGEQIVLVLDNGAVFDVQPDHSLQFLDSVYPRHAKP